VDDDVVQPEVDNDMTFVPKSEDVEDAGEVEDE
jgi:hypothetical protein